MNRIPEEGFFQPRVRPKHRYPLTPELDHVRKHVLPKIMKHPLALPFKHPVDAITEGIYPDYFLVISHPMDLYSVRARLTHGWYLNMGQFIQDINLVWRNARQFNPPDHLLHQWAVQLQEITNKLLRQTRKTLEKQKPKDLRFCERILSTLIQESDQGLRVEPVQRLRVEPAQGLRVEPVQGLRVEPDQVLSYSDPLQVPFNPRTQHDQNSHSYPGILSPPSSLPQFSPYSIPQSSPYSIPQSSPRPISHSLPHSSIHSPSYPSSHSSLPTSHSPLQSLPLYSPHNSLTPQSLSLSPTHSQGKESPFHHSLSPPHSPPSQSLTAPSQSIPAPPQSIPAPSQSLPAPSQSIPAPSQSIPASSQSLPASSQSIPAPSQSILASSKFIPVSSQSLPAPSLSLNSTANVFPLRKLENKLKSGKYETSEAFAEDFRRMIGDVYRQFSTDDPCIQIAQHLHHRFEYEYARGIKAEEDEIMNEKEAAEIALLENMKKEATAIEEQLEQLIQEENERLEDARMEEARGLVDKISLLDCSRLTEVLAILEQDGENVEQDKDEEDTVTLDFRRMSHTAIRHIKKYLRSIDHSPEIQRSDRQV